MRVRPEPLGTRTLYVALILAFVGEIVWFPVWNVQGGSSSMLILLGYITNEPLAFILDRLLPAAAVLGVLAATLIEIGRRRAGREAGRWLDRERIALLVALVGEGVALSPFAFIDSVGPDLIAFEGAMGVAVTVAVGLYLYWVAAGRVSSMAKTCLMLALCLAVVSAALAIMLSVALGAPASGGLNGISQLDVTRWILGETSLALWVVVYTLVVVWGRTPSAPAPAAA